MDDSISSALISGSTQLASTALSAAATAYENRKNFERADTWDKTARQRNREDTAYYWDMYNSPQAQMRAYQEAGLNPNLIYGNSNTVTPVSHSSSPPDYTVPRIDFASAVNNALNMYYAAQSNERQNQLAAAQVANLTAQAENANARTVNESQRNALLQQQTELNRLRIELENSTNPLRTKYLQKQITMLDENITTQVLNRSLQQQRMDLDVNRFLYQKKIDKMRLNQDLYKFNNLSGYQKELLKWNQSPGSANTWLGSILRLLYGNNNSSSPNFDAMRSDGMRQQGIYYEVP